MGLADLPSPRPRYCTRRTGSAVRRFAGFHSFRWLDLEADAIVRARRGYTLPTWLTDLDWVDAGEDLGWGVHRATSIARGGPLLTKLASPNAPGGLRFVERENGTAIANRATAPTYGVALHNQ